MVGWLVCKKVQSVLICNRGKNLATNGHKLSRKMESINSVEICVNLWLIFVLFIRVHSWLNSY